MSALSPQPGSRRDPSIPSGRLARLHSWVWLKMTYLPDRMSDGSPTSHEAPRADADGSRLSAGAAHLGAPPASSVARRKATVDVVMLALGVTAAAVCASGTSDPARPLLVLAAACLIPGAAILTRLPAGDPFEALGLACVLGLAVETVGALFMVWTGWWHPFGWAILVVLGACVALLVDFSRQLVILRNGSN